MEPPHGNKRFVTGQWDGCVFDRTETAVWDVLPDFEKDAEKYQLCCCLVWLELNLEDVFGGEWESGGTNGGTSEGDPEARLLQQLFADVEQLFGWEIPANVRKVFQRRVWKLAKWYAEVVLVNRTGGGKKTRSPKKNKNATPRKGDADEEQQGGGGDGSAHVGEGQHRLAQVRVPRFGGSPAEGRRAPETTGSGEPLDDLDAALGLSSGPLGGVRGGGSSAVAMTAVPHLEPLQPFKHDTEQEPYFLRTSPTQLRSLDGGPPTLGAPSSPTQLRSLDGGPPTLGAPSSPTQLRSLDGGPPTLGAQTQLRFLDGGPPTLGAPTQLRSLDGGPPTLGAPTQLRSLDGGPPTLGAPTQLRSLDGGPPTLGASALSPLAVRAPAPTGLSPLERVGGVGPGGPSTSSSPSALAPVPPLGTLKGVKGSPPRKVLQTVD